MKFQKPRGTKDILPKEIYKWHYVEKIIREVTSYFNFSEIRTPTFENTQLFVKGTGEESDIVGKEMYTFEDKGGSSLTLRPEMTPPVVRAYLENGLANESPLQKLYYISNIFRYEKPQEGRYREHVQFGAEILGTDDISSDIETILLAKEVLNKCGISDYNVKINSIGKLDERKKYILRLKEYLGKSFEELSDDSKRRYNNNPLRILDSKDEKDVQITNNAPKILDHLTKESRQRFDKVIDSLSSLGVECNIDFRLVRGIDYYTDTTFEFISDVLGSQNALVGGGRYDNLVETMDGKPTPCIGFASGLERVILTAERCQFNFPDREQLKVYVIALNEKAKNIAMKYCYSFREKNISCDIDMLNRSLKSQMREANRMNAEYVFIIGDEELKKQQGILKKMSDGSQQEIPFDELYKSIFKTMAQS